MRSRLLRLYTSPTPRNSSAVIQRALMCSCLCIPQICTAQDEPPSSTATSKTNTGGINTESSPDAIPVETGAGGDIRIERKYRTVAESQFEWHAHLLWESRYVTEGRDNLSGNNLVSVSSEFAIDELSVVPWFATSPSADYSEFNLNIVYGTQLAQGLIIYAGYNRIQAKDNGVSGNDNEISLDLAYKFSKQLNLLASVYHSFDADGAFIELAVKRGHRLNEKTRVRAQAVLGTNAGYVSDGHHGLNNVQLRANITYEPTTKMELYAYSGYNIAINRDEIRYTGDVLLDDFFWGGVGFTSRF
ncbi:MAG: hypothetical protein WBN96_15420 [Gammaproteobacteria bacterium]